MHNHARSTNDIVAASQQLRLSRRALVQGSAGAVLAAAASPALLAAQSTPESDDGAGPVLPLYPHGQPIILDPHRATNWGPHWLLLPYVWAGLLGFDAQGAVVPALASSVEPEEDGLVWVAAIRPEATFASGNPVTASALIEGWKRALDPQRPAPMSTYMRRVEGYDAFVSGEGEEIGFEARDEQTVAIRLTEPYALFREDLATFVWAAVDVAALADVPPSQVPYSDASAGRWRFAESSGSDDIVLALRDDATSGPASFSRVTWRPFEGPLAAEDAVAALQAGDLALADAPPAIRSALESDDAIGATMEVIEPSGSTMLLGMDFRQPPFDEPRVRRAVAHAIDRERWATEIMDRAFVAATAITPPVIAQNANYAPPESLGFDPDTARSLLREAGISEEDMPTITWYRPADATEQEIEQATALATMIQENSGLVLEMDRSLTASQIDALRRDERGLQFDLRWWWPLTNSPSGLADLGLAASPDMDGWFNWSDDLKNAEAAGAAAQFAELIAQAQAAMDQTERTQLFAQAESLLVEHAVYVPLGHWQQAFLRSDRLEGTRHGAFSGYMPIAFDEAVSWTPAQDSTPTT